MMDAIVEQVYTDALSGSTHSKDKINDRNGRGFTALMLAVERENLNVLRALLEAGADLNIANNKSETPLMFAIKYKHTSAAEFLLVHKNTETTCNININTCDDDQITPLMFAVKRSSFDIVTQLLEQGADVNLRDKNKNTVLHYCVMTGFLKVFLKLVKAGADINVCNADCETPLIIASKLVSQYIRKNNCADTTDILEYLILSKADVNCKDKDMKTALHFAVYTPKPVVDPCMYPHQLYEAIQDKNMIERQKTTDIINLLLKHGAEVNAADKDKMSPLHYCVDSGKSEHVKLLVDAGADVNLQDVNLETPLIVAAKLQLKYFNATSLSSKYDSNSDDYVVDGRNNEQYLEATKIVNHLITPTAEVNIADKDHNTTLHFASQCNIETVTYLLSKSANIDLLNNSGESALHLAAISERNYRLILDYLLELLIQRRSQLKKKYECFDQPVFKFEKMNDGLFNIIDLQNEGWDTESIIDVQNKTYIISLLLDYDADIMSRNNHDYTVLHFAVEHSCVKAVKRILSMECDVNQATKNGQTPLTLAIDGEIFRVLRAAGADENYQINGESVLIHTIRCNSPDIIEQISQHVANIESGVPDPPLIFAIILNNIEIVNILLERGANVNVISSNGFSPLMVASQLNLTEIISALLEKGADINMSSAEGMTPLICCLQNYQNNSSGPCAELLLESGANPLINENYRGLLRAFKLKKLFDKCWFNHLRLLVRNRVMLKYMEISEDGNETIERTAFTMSIGYRRLDVTKYLLSTGYITLGDLKLIYLIQQTADLGLGNPFHSKLKEILNRAFYQPLSLQKHVFIAISTMFDEDPERDEYLDCLPVILKGGFKVGPTSSILPVKIWSSIVINAETAMSILPDTRSLS